jgi:hypothetical protein
VESISITRELHNEGFHKELATEVTFSSKSKDKSNCVLMMMQRFSESIYLDKFQLEELERLDTMWTNKKFFLEKEVNLESPSYSPSSTPFHFFVLFSSL